MNVRELSLLLKMLPEGMPIILDGHGAFHVDAAERQTLQHYHDGPQSIFRNRLGEAVMERPAALVLRGRTRWYDPEPDFEIQGRWRLSVLTETERVELLGDPS
jgi:hypothetical protein